ncbi:hypothetical protein [Thermocatellispora tengchongensis]|uniref:hypothetical protein n=1 Tax=Thermocatellispora tengchongensis TaxID=1073253 RepID=UPI00363218C6
MTVTVHEAGARAPQVAVWAHESRPGSRCVVVANFDDEPRTYAVAIDGPRVVLRPEGGEPEPLEAGRLALGPRSAAVLADPADL